MGSSFESWIYRSVGMDPSLPPCQSPVSTNRWFPWITAFLSVWEEVSHPRGQTIYQRWMIMKNCPNFLCSNWLLWFSPHGNPWLTGNRGSTILQAWPFTFLYENVFTYETLHLISFCLVVPSYICSQRWQLTFPLRKYSFVDEELGHRYIQGSPLPNKLEKEMATHSSMLAWKILWTKEPGRLQSMGSQEPDMTQRLNQPPY